MTSFISLVAGATGIVSYLNMNEYEAVSNSNIADGKTISELKNDSMIPNVIIAGIYTDKNGFNFVSNIMTEDHSQQQIEIGFVPWGLRPQNNQRFMTSGDLYKSPTGQLNLIRKTLINKEPMRIVDYKIRAAHRYTRNRGLLIASTAITAITGLFITATMFSKKK